jgi:hypothetical protein
MTGHRGALLLVALAPLGPAIAIGMTVLVDQYGDSVEQHHLLELWIACALWPFVCLFSASRQWTRGS